MKPLFAFTADWHIAKSAWSRSGIDGDAKHALAAVVDYCVRNELPLVAGGDLFDTVDPSPDDVKAVRLQMDRMKRAKLPVYFTQGQHERRTPPWLSSVHHWPTHVDGVTFEIGGVKIHGLDWRNAASLQEALGKIDPAATVLVCHQVWKDLMGGQAECEGCFADTPSHIELVLTGDFHKRVVKHFSRTDGSVGLTLSPGSLAMQSIDEESVKGFFVICENLDANVVQLESRRFRGYSVDDEESLSELIVNGLAYLDTEMIEVVASGDLHPDLHKPLIRVRHPAKLPGAAGRLKAASAGKYHLFLDPVTEVDAETGVDRVEAAKALAERGMLGVLETMPLEGADAAWVRTAVAALLAANDPEHVLDELCRSTA